MKLLFITNVFPSPWCPGLGVFNRELVRALAVNHQVSVVCPVSWVQRLRGGWRQRDSVADEKACGAGLDVRHPCFYYPPKMLRSYYGAFLWHSVAPVVRELLDSRRPEAVLAYWTHPDGEAAVRAARLAGVPAVIMVGGSDVLILARQRRRRRCILRVLHAADGVIAVSQHLMSKLVDFGVPAAKIHVVYRGVTGAFHPGSRLEARRALEITSAETMLLWVGRMVPVKGLDVLLNACALLRQRGQHFRLYLVGNGPLRRSLEGKVDALGLREFIRFVGPMPHERLPDWYRAADVTVLPSRSEGVPNVLLESLACGTPFVASAVGGIPELDGGACSRLVPPENPELLAEALERTIRQPKDVTSNGYHPRSQGEAAEAVLRVIRGLTHPQEAPALRGADAVPSVT